MLLLMMMLVILMVAVKKVAAVRSDNHVGISSFVFSNTGRGLYMSTCNELQEIRWGSSLTHNNTLFKD